MSNSIRRNFKKQTLEQRVTQIGRVQTEMWIAFKKLTRELGKIQDILGYVDEEEEKTEEE